VARGQPHEQGRPTPPQPPPPPPHPPPPPQTTPPHPNDWITTVECRENDACHPRRLDLSRQIGNWRRGRSASNGGRMRQAQTQRPPIPAISNRPPPPPSAATGFPAAYWALVPASPRPGRNNGLAFRRSPCPQPFFHGEYSRHRLGVKRRFRSSWNSTTTPPPHTPPPQAHPTPTGQLPLPAPAQPRRSAPRRGRACSCHREDWSGRVRAALNAPQTSRARLRGAIGLAKVQPPPPTPSLFSFHLTLPHSTVLLHYPL